jgi:glycosyltransferase involved in cell wall biosynthesis
LKIAFLSEWDPFDPNQRSGVPFFIANSLEKNGVEVIHIPIRAGKRKIWHKVGGRLLMFFFNTLLRQKRGFYIQNRSREYAHSYSRQAEKHIQKTNPDAIFSTGTIPIAYLNTDKPIILWLDATFANLYGYYSKVNHYHPVSLKQAHRTEKAALNKAKLLILCSAWAAEAAVKTYGCNPEKIKIIPRGANLLVTPTKKEVQINITEKDFSHCRLLFIGSDWERKGGAIILEVGKLLNQKRVKLELHLVGAQPPEDVALPEWVHIHGRLRKGVAEEQEKMERLFLQSHFLFVPTRAEAFGIVYAEASAYGLPSIGTDTGGVGAVIMNEQNGQRFSFDSSTETYADYILGLFKDREAYTRLAMRSREVYEESFDWHKNVSKMIRYLKGN